MWPRETHVSHSKEVLFMSMPFEDLAGKWLDLFLKQFLELLCGDCNVSPDF